MLNIWSGNIVQKNLGKFYIFPSAFYGRGTLYKKNLCKFYIFPSAYMVGEHCNYVWSVYSSPRWTENYENMFPAIRKINGYKCSGPPRCSIEKRRLKKTKTFKSVTSQGTLYLYMFFYIRPWWTYIENRSNLYWWEKSSLLTLYLPIWSLKCCLEFPGSFGPPKKLYNRLPRRKIYTI